MNKVFCNLSSKAIRVIAAGWKNVWEEHRVAFLTTVVVVSAIKIHMSSKKKRLRHKWDSVGENVVVLHGLPRVKIMPNLSPFVLKLETYLRMAGIEYVLDSEEAMGSKGKTPWITLNGEDYTDSELIIDFLGRKFNKNFSANLKQEHKAVARAMLIMTDEHFFWLTLWWRMIKDPAETLFTLMDFPKILKPLIRNRIRKMLWAQGLGRHSDAEKELMIRKDIEALSLYLGNKPFMMGETPCEVDCAIFGSISQCAWAMPGSSFESMVKNDYRNLLEYCDRMKEKFWPDWEDKLGRESENVFLKFLELLKHLAR